MADDAASVMTRNVCKVGPYDTVATVAKILAAHDISAVPVCDKGGALLGLVSEGDLLRPFARTNQLRRAWWLSLLGEGSDLAPEFTEYLRQDHRIVSELMTSPVITATESATIPELSELLMRQKIKRVPIVRDGRVVGIVSRADLVRALAQLPASTADWQ